MMARLLALAVGSAFAEGRPSLPVPSFKISLDDKPEQRYNHVIGHFNDTLHGAMRTLAKAHLLGIAKLFAEHRGEEEPELQAEIRGIAREASIPEDVIHTLAFLYELDALGVPVENISWSWPWPEAPPPAGGWGRHSLASAFGDIGGFGGFFGCTGIIIRGDDGTVYHGRNLDFYLPGWLQNLTYLATFTRGGKELFVAQMIAAYPMPTTAMRRGPDGYAMELNTRFLDHWGGNKQLMDNIFKEKRAPSGWVKRKVLEHIPTYAAAVEAFAGMPYIATEFNIVSGVKKGTILARNPNGLAYRIDLNETDRYLVVTNFDYIYGDVREHIDPTSVMGIGHSRRKGAMKLLDRTPHISSEILMDLMFDEEVAGWETIFQAVFNIEKDTMITRLPPCEACNGCLDDGRCVSGRRFCCSSRSHFSARCATHSVARAFRCGCLPDGACRQARPSVNTSVGVEDCCSLEDHFTLSCPGLRRCGKAAPFVV